jgi:hypothetical protein
MTFEEVNTYVKTRRIRELEEYRNLGCKINQHAISNPLNLYVKKHGGLENYRDTGNQVAN